MYSYLQSSVFHINFHFKCILTLCNICVLAVAVALNQACRPEFKVYQEQVIANARVMSKVLQEKGYKVVTGENLDTITNFNKLVTIHE